MTKKASIKARIRPRSKYDSLSILPRLPRIRARLPVVIEAPNECGPGWRVRGIYSYRDDGSVPATE